MGESSVILRIATYFIKKAWENVAVLIEARTCNYYIEHLPEARTFNYRQALNKWETPFIV